MRNWESTARRLGAQVRKLRAGLGLSQEELGYAATIHRTYITEIERGRRNPSLWTLERLAIGLRCELRDLFPLEDPESPPTKLSARGSPQ